MSDKSIKISVIVTTRNNLTRLRRALMSVLRQTFKHFEILVVNDGGEDVSPVLDEFSDRRISLISHIGKQGAAAARNSGIRKARGEYLAFLEDSDFLYPMHLEICNKYLMLGHKVVYTDAVKASYHRSQGKEQLLEKQLAESPDYEKDILMLHQFAPVPCFVLLRQLAFEAGLLNEHFSSLDFWDFLIRVSHSALFLHINQATVQTNFYFSDTTNAIQQKKAAEKAKEKISRQYKSDFDRIINREQLQERVRKHLIDSETMQYPLISIIFICGRSLEETRKVLQSISAQVPFNYEIIVVELSNNEETLTYLEEYGKEHTRLHIIRIKEFRGTTASLAEAMTIAKGSYYLLIESDIVFTPGCIARLVELAEEDYYNGIILPADNFSDNDARNTLSGNPSDERLEKYAEERRKRYGKTTSVPKEASFMCTLIKSEAVKASGFPDKKFAFGSSAAEDFFYKAASARFKILRAEDAFIYHKNTDYSNDIYKFIPYEPSATFTAIPIVSVIICTYNRYDELKRAVGSVLNQTYENFEIVVINDGGEDIKGLITSFNDKRIRYYQHRENRGISAARNTGLLKARGKYIAYLDDDDIFYRSHLQTTLDELEKNDFALVFTGTAEVRQEETGGEIVNMKKVNHTAQTFQLEELLIENYLFLPSVVHHRKVIEKSGLFDETLSKFEAWDLWLRIARYYLFKPIDKITCQFHIPEDGNTLSNRRKIESLRAMSIIHRRYRKLITDKEKTAERQRESIKRLKEQLKEEEIKPVVSILVPVYNRAERIASVNTKFYRTAENRLFEIIYIDNNSTDGTTKILNGLARELINLGLLQNPENLGFAKAVNIAAKHARGEFLLLAHDDIEPEPGWLKELLETMYDDETIGVVGAKLINPDKTIDHAGIALIEREKQSFPLQPIHLYAGRPADAPEVGRPMMYQAVSAACMLIRKEAFDKVGGLDERYWNDYSHIDFCLKLAHSGYKTVYQPKCRVVHYKRSYKIYAYTKLFENLRLFDSKWLGKVTYDYRRKTDGSYEKLPGSPIKLYYPTPAGIIVICDGNPEHTRNCVESILAHTDVPFTLLFVDREFDSEATEYMKHIAEAPNIRYCSSPESDSVSLALNKSLKENIGGITVFVKSEVAVTPGWLSRLLEAMYIEEKIGIVSTMTNKASNAQQDKNAQYSTLEEMYAYAADVSEQNKGKYFTTSRIEFFCTLVKKEVFRKIGGFDERFELGTFVDDDFSLRSKKAGFKNAVIKDVFVHRHGTLDRPGISEQEYQSRINRSKAAFIKKWGGEPEQAAKSKKRYDSKKIYFPLVTDTLSELYRRAVYYTKEEEFNLAYNYYVKLFHAPDIDTVENENMALYLSNAGKLCLRLKKFSDAIRYFIRELELNDKSVRAYESLGDAYHSLGDFNKAIEMYENALAISSTSESVRQKRQRYFK